MYTYTRAFYATPPSPTSEPSLCIGTFTPFTLHLKLHHRHHLASTRPCTVHVRPQPPSPPHIHTVHGTQAPSTTNHRRPPHIHTPLHGTTRHPHTSQEQLSTVRPDLQSGGHATPKTPTLFLHSQNARTIRNLLLTWTVFRIQATASPRDRATANNRPAASDVLYTVARIYDALRREREGERIGNVQCERINTNSSPSPLNKSQLPNHHESCQ